MSDRDLPQITVQPGTPRARANPRIKKQARSRVKLSELVRSLGSPVRVAEVVGGHPSPSIDAAARAAARGPANLNVILAVAIVAMTAIRRVKYYCD